MATLKTVLIITITTARLIFPGLPGARGLGAADQPPAARSISFELASDAAATKDSKASISLPEGLKLGKTIELEVDPAGVPKPEVEQPSKLIVHKYWGSSREVAGNQPKVSEPNGAAPPLDPGIPTKSYASWPTMESPDLQRNAATPGDYSLTTDYCGSTTVTLAPEQNFLAPVNITNPTSEPDLSKPIVVNWRPIPNAVGYMLKAYGGDNEKTITWTSATKPELAEEIEYRPLTKEEVDSLIQDGVLLPSYTISATIPAGIFKGASSVMLLVTAFGKDMVQTKDGVETQVIVRSTASSPLYSTPFPLPPSKRNAEK